MKTHTFPTSSSRNVYDGWPIAYKKGHVILRIQLEYMEIM